MSLTAEEKEAIMASRGQSSIRSTGARKYEIHLQDGRTFTCIDLVNDPPEQVMAGIKAQFGHYGIKEIVS